MPVISALGGWSEKNQGFKGSFSIYWVQDQPLLQSDLVLEKKKKDDSIIEGNSILSKDFKAGIAEKFP